MADPWYERVTGDAGILQGDLILDCPLLVWKSDLEIEGEGKDEELATLFEIVAEDVVVMTQACDLEQRKVTEVVVCSLYNLEEMRTLWVKTQQGTSDKAWHNFFDKITSGSVWNLAVLNKGESNGLSTPHRIVDFHNIATIPLPYLQSIAAKRGPRLRLRPPYREHLSQSFARYFMRVGLPSNVDSPW
jgi:hypothetical protein